MNKRIWLLGIIFLLTIATAHADIVYMGDNVTAGQWFGNDGATQYLDVAQTFYNYHIDRNLEGATFQIGGSSGVVDCDVSFTVMNVDGTNKPNMSSIIGQKNLTINKTYTQWRVNFDEAIPLTANTTYAIGWLLQPSCVQANTYKYFFLETGNPYSDGAMYYRDSGASTWTSTTSDIYMKMHMQEADVYYYNSNILSHYSFDDLTDSVGSNDLTTSGTGQTQLNGSDSIHGAYYYFDGNGKLQDTSATFTGIGDEGSIGMWVKYNASGLSPIVDTRDTGPDSGIEIQPRDDGTIDYGYKEGTGDWGSIDDKWDNDNNWHYWVQTWKNGGQVRIYVDGVLIDSYAESFLPMTDWIKIYIGGDLGTNYLVGTIDEVTVWDVQLPADEIEALSTGRLFYPFTTTDKTISEKLEEKVVFEYDLEEGKGNYLFDRKGGYTTANITGDTTWIRDRQGLQDQKLYLDETDDAHIRINGDAFQNRDHTFILTFDSTNTAEDNLFGWVDATGKGMFARSKSGTQKLQLWTDDGDNVQIESTANYFDGNIHTLILTYDADINELTMYVDGTKEGNVSNFGYYPPTYSVFVGTRSGNGLDTPVLTYTLDGSIHYIAMYDEVLTQEEMEYMYENNHIIRTDNTSQTYQLLMNQSRDDEVYIVELNGSTECYGRDDISIWDGATEVEFTYWNDNYQKLSFVTTGATNYTMMCNGTGTGATNKIEAWMDCDGSFTTSNNFTTDTMTNFGCQDSYSTKGYGLEHNADGSDDKAYITFDEYTTGNITMVGDWAVADSTSVYHVLALIDDYSTTFVNSMAYYHTSTTIAGLGSYYTSPSNTWVEFGVDPSNYEFVGFTAIADMDSGISSKRNTYFWTDETSEPSTYTRGTVNGIDGFMIYSNGASNDIYLDEFMIINGTARKYSQLSTYSFTPLTSESGPAGPTPNQTITLHTPTNEYHVNYTTILFNYTYTGLTANCTLNINNIAYGTNLSVTNNTNININNNATLTEGNHSWNITCIDGPNNGTSDTRTITIDTTGPESTQYSPLEGQTYNDGFNVLFNVSDTYIWGISYNITHPNGSIVASFTQENYTTDYELINDTINTKGWISGWYHFRKQYSDDHTDLHWRPSKIELKGDRLRIDEAISVMPENFDIINMTYEVKTDRISYCFIPAEGFNPPYTYEVESDAGLYWRSFTGINGHFVGAGKYWLDFENEDDYPAYVWVVNTKQAIVTTNATCFNSIGGLNFGEDNFSFYFDGDYERIAIQANEIHTGNNVNNFTINSTEGRTDTTTNNTAYLILNTSNTEWLTFTKTGWYSTTENHTGETNKTMTAWDTQINITVYDWLRESNILDWNLSGDYASGSTDNGSIIHKTVTSLVGTEDLTVSGGNFTSETWQLTNNETYNYQRNVTSTIIDYFYLYIYHHLGSTLLTNPSTLSLNTSNSYVGNPWKENILNYLDEDNKNYQIFLNVTDTGYIHIPATYNFTYNTTTKTHYVNMSPNELMLYFYQSNGSLTSVEGTIIDSENLESTFNGTSVLVIQEDIANGKVLVLINHIGYVNWTQYYEYIKTTGQHITENIYITDQIDWSVYYQVLDQNERLIENAVIRLEYFYADSGIGTAFANRVLGQRLTNADGQTFFLLDSDIIARVTVTKDGYTPVIFQEAVGDEEWTSSNPRQIILTKSEFGADNQKWDLMPRRFENRSASISGLVMSKGMTTVSYTTAYRISQGESTSDVTTLCNAYDECPITLVSGIDYNPIGNSNITLMLYTDGENWRNVTIVYKDQEEVTDAFKIENTIEQKWLNIALFIMILTLSVGASLLIRNPNAGLYTFIATGALASIISSSFLWLGLIAVLYFIIKVLIKRMIETP